MNTIVPAIGFGIVAASILAVAGVGFALQFGVTNILNLAYGDIMTAAAFVAYLVTSAGLSVWLALVAGAAFGSVFSVLLNRCIARAHSTVDAREALVDLGYDVLDTAVPRREVYAQSFGMPIKQTGVDIWRQVARDLIGRCAPLCSIRS